jgi:hypothetical protein
LSARYVIIRRSKGNPWRILRNPKIDENKKIPYKREDAGYLSIPGYYYEKVISKANREKLFTGVRLPLAINL